jgi:hypothetical protein
MNYDLYNFWLNTPYQMMYLGETVAKMDLSSDKALLAAFNIVESTGEAKVSTFKDKALVTKGDSGFPLDHFMVVMPVAPKLFGDTNP